MSWYLYDSNGYVGDFATYEGLRELQALNLPGVNELIDRGGAGPALINTVVEELKDEPEFAHVRQLLDKADPPVMITDGIEES